MNKKQKNLLIRILAAGVCMVILAFLPLDGYPVLRFLLYLIPYLTVGYDILRKAWKGIMNRQVFDENFLMAVATIGAMVLGEYTESVAVMWFYQIGELFQSWAVGRSRRSISELMDIRPDYANLEEDGQIRKVDPDEVEIGSVIVIRPGEKVPIDGIITEGSSTMNTAALTGESLPREVGPGDEVLSGFINTSGLLHVETTCEFDESTASKILAAGGPDAHGNGAGVGDMGLQGAYIPGHQLSLRHRGQHSAQLFRRTGRGQQPGHPDQGVQLYGDPGVCQNCCL